MLIKIKKQLNGANVRLYEKLDQKFSFNLFNLFNLQNNWTETNYQEIFDVLWRAAENANNISELNKNIHLYLAVKRIKRKQSKKKYLHFYFKKDR